MSSDTDPSFDRMSASVDSSDFRTILPSSDTCEDSQITDAFQVTDSEMGEYSIRFMDGQVPVDMSQLLPFTVGCTITARILFCRSSP